MNASFLPFVFVLVIGLPLLGTAAQWAALRFARVPVTSVSVFNGSPITTFTIFGTTITIGCIPTGSSVAFDIPVFRSRSLLTRLAVILSGPAALLVFAVVLLSLPQALSHFISGFFQLVVGAIHPRTTAIEFITRLHTVFSSSASTASGIIAAKLAALALLPLGGMAAAESVRQFLGSFGEHGVVTAFLTISALVAILLSILWLLAIFFYVSN
ncbi:MAG: site-2 protease family protein [Roseimicrobium sp.]